MLYAEYIQLNEVYMKPPLRVRRIFLTGNLENSTRKLSIVNQPFSESGWCEAMMGTTKEKIGQGEEEEESNHLKAN